ncbi:MAG: purine/pyrimidine permease, partial [Myxococcales bacterium]|nr:purine/pyrimidine permease [Myxococcales bacterium]
MTPPLIRYDIDDRPPLGTLLLFGLQWLAVVGVSTIVMGKVLAALHFTAPADQFLYMQKLFFATGMALLAQLFVGHRLPLVIGPAAILLVGILASGARDTAALYSSIMIGGALLALLCATGLFRYVARLFTYRVVATILMLIAIAITPTVLALVVDAPEPRDAVRHLLFALGLLVAMVAGDRLLRGAWRATLLLWALALGSALCFWLLPDTAPSAAPADQPLFASLFRDVTAPLHWDLGLILSFLICFIALAVNDLGSIESLGKLLQPPAMAQRLTRGMTVTGLANVLAGFLGVVGVVNFSLSAGIISANGNASRLSFLPAALCLVLMAFSP